MPMWQIYHPRTAFTGQDKQSIAKQVTGLYENFLPRFYVNVLFHGMPEADFYVGGEPVDDFVRVTIEHIARSLKDAEAQQRFLKACARVLDPFVAARGLRWEMHIDETPFELWTLNGYNPPRPNTAAEARWRAENKASAYEQG